MKLINNIAFENMIKYYEEKYNTVYTTGHLEILRSDYEKGFDISSFIDPRLTIRQLNMIFDGLDNDLDVALYANADMDVTQMSEIKDGLEQGLNVRIYADSKYPWYVMRFAKQCLLYNINPEPMLNEKLGYIDALNLFAELEPNEVLG